MSDSALSRREFLERAAYTAGMAGAAASLPASALLAQAAKAVASPLPNPRNVPIDHFVIVMMENRSFDHYFGWLSGLADGVQDQTYPNADGQPVQTRHASTLEAEWQGCGHPDPGHGWESGRVQLNNGFLAEGSGNDEFALTYYDEGELGFIHPAAREFTLLLLAARTDLAEPVLQVVGAVRRPQGQHPAGRLGARQRVGHDLRPGAGQQPGQPPDAGRPDRPLLQLRPALLGGLGRPRRPLDPADRRVLRRLRDGHPAQHLDRRPAVPRRRRGRRPLGG